MLKRFFYLILIFLVFTSLVKAKNIDLFPYLLKFKERVKKDLKGKVPEKYIDKVFNSSEIAYLPQIMIKSLTWKEVELPYYQFLEKDRILRAKKFMIENGLFLEKLERTFGVEKEVLTAMFLIETDLGRKTGKYSIFNSFFSMALSGEEKLFKNYLNGTEISLEDPFIKKKLYKRSKWAYEELLYLIQIAYKNHWDPFQIKGSIFGAFGYPQFVPRSYLIYGYDWNKDGIVDLYNIEDALASMANYLKIEGYKINADIKYKKQVIMKYNHSEPYVQTVFAIAKKLKEICPPQKKR